MIDRVSLAARSEGVSLPQQAPEKRVRRRRKCSIDKARLRAESGGALMTASKSIAAVRSSAEVIPSEAALTVKPVSTRRKAPAARARAQIRSKHRSRAEQDIFWGHHFVTGALTLGLARTGRIDHLSGGLCRSEDFEPIKARMARVMAGGFVAICQQRAAERKAEADE